MSLALATTEKGAQRLSASKITAQYMCKYLFLKGKYIGMSCTTLNLLHVLISLHFSARKILIFPVLMRGKHLIVARAYLNH